MLLYTMIPRIHNERSHHQSKFYEFASIHGKSTKFNITCTLTTEKIDYVYLGIEAWTERLELLVFKGINS
jgi:hypothetical protein